MDKARARDRRKHAEEFGPNPLLPRCVVGPEGMLNGAVGGYDSNSDKVIEIAVGQAFDIEIDCGAVELWLPNTDCMNLILADLRELSKNDDTSRV